MAIVFICTVWQGDLARLQLRITQQAKKHKYDSTTARSRLENCDYKIMSISEATDVQQERRSERARQTRLCLLAQTGEGTIIATSVIAVEEWATMPPCARTRADKAAQLEPQERRETRESRHRSSQGIPHQCPDSLVFSFLLVPLLGLLALVLPHGGNVAEFWCAKLRPLGGG